MNPYIMLEVILAGVIMVTLIMNLVQVFKETKKLKEEGKTPLTVRNFAVVTVAAIAEALVVYLLTLLFAAMDVKTTYAGIFAMFVMMYLLRNVGAYLSAWGLWALFLQIDKRKAVKEIKEDKEKATTF